MSTETLRPNAVGDESNLTASPAVDNYENVDEASSDDDITINFTLNTVYQRDLYGIADSSGSGTINKITVYARCKGVGPA